MLRSDIVVRFSSKPCVVLLQQSKKLKSDRVSLASEKDEASGKRTCKYIDKQNIYSSDLHISIVKLILLERFNPFLGVSCTASGVQSLSRCLIKALVEFIKFELFAFDCSFLPSTLSMFALISFHFTHRVIIQILVLQHKI